MLAVRPVSRAPSTLRSNANSAPTTNTEHIVPRSNILASTNRLQSRTTKSSNLQTPARSFTNSLFNQPRLEFAKNAKGTFIFASKTPQASLAKRFYAMGPAGGMQQPPWVNPDAVPVGDSIRKYAKDLTEMGK
jgi:hypothetical protein